MGRIAAILAFSALVAALPAAAHPPGGIKVYFDLEEAKVKVEIEHAVKDIKSHYIHEIEVTVNGKKLIKQEATEQTDAQKQYVIYVVPGLKAGDRVKVYGDCSKFGDISKEFTAVPGPEKEKKEAKPSKMVKPGGR